MPVKWNPLSPVPHPPTCSSQKISKGLEYQPKSMKTTHLLAFYIVFKFWRLLLIKILGYSSHWVFYLFCFILDFTSADIIFHQFLELYLTSGKKVFVINFPFLTDSLKPPPPYKGQNLLIVTKFFVDAPSSSVRENPQLG